MTVRVVDPALRSYPVGIVVHATLAAAATAAAPGDTIYIRGDQGVYYENDLYTTAHSSLWDVYAGDERPVVDGKGEAKHVFRLHGTGLTLASLCIRNAAAIRYCVALSATGQRVRDCIIGPTAGDGVYSGAADTHLQRTVLQDCAKDGADLFHATGTVENVLALGGERGLVIGSGMNAAHVTAIGQSQRGISLSGTATLRNALAAGCTGTGAQHGGIVLLDAGTEVRYSSAWGNAGGLDFNVVAGTLGPGCDTNAAPFVDAAGDDYRLDHDPPTLVNPAVSSGEDAGVTDDLDGVARPQGVGFDRGAYEWVPTPPSVLSADFDPSDAVLVTFSEDMNDAGGMLDPGAWALRDTATHTPVTLLSVSRPATDTARVIADTALAGDTEYEATAPADVESDATGALIDPAGRAATFTTPPSPVPPPVPPALPTEDLAEEIQKLLPSWLLDDELVDAILWSVAAALHTTRERAAVLFLRLALEDSDGAWLTTLAREHGAQRAFGEAEASLRIRGRLQPRGVTRPGILGEVDLRMREGHRAWLIEADAGPMGAASYCDREMYCDRADHIVDDDHWHRFWLLIEKPPVVLREIAYCDREDFYCDREDGDGWSDTDMADFDENVLRRIARAVDAARLAGVRFRILILDNPYV
jgi:hypothetical protein